MRVFLASLRAVGSSADVVIFSAESGRADLAEVATTFDARIIEYDFERLSAKYGPMNLHRFHLFRGFLEEAGHATYAQVLLCDVRDVYFQLDPFEALGLDDGLGVAIEPEHLTIGACDIHARWLSDECSAYKVELVLDQIADKSRSCAGTTIGTQLAIAKYCHLMEDEASRTVREIGEAQALPFAGRITSYDGNKWWCWCNDQGMHNVLLWTGRLQQHVNVTFYRAENSPLATVGTMKVRRPCWSESTRR